MTNILCGDIDGEYTEFKLFSCHYRKETELYNGKYFTNHFTSFEQCLSAILTKLKGHLPNYICIGVAAPITENEIKVTNSRWPKFNITDIQNMYPKIKIQFINDFEASAHGLLSLDDSSLLQVNQQAPVPGATKIVIGAGSGLGECFLTKSPGSPNYCIHPTEGGHTDYSPKTVLEYGFLEYVKEYLDLDRVSTERCISRSGIALLYCYLKEMCPFIYSPMSEIPNKLNWHTIVDVGLSKKDEICVKTVEMFLNMFGSEIGNFALKSMPYGGIYIVGEIAVVLKDKILKEKEFIESIVNKGRMKPILEKMPIYLVDKNIRLIGAKEVAIRWL
jgi:glucokinase